MKSSIMRAAQTRYSGGAIVLHWLLALALAFQLALGFVMPRDASGFALFQLHKSVGITVLLLTLVRIGWRLAHKAPPAVEGGVGGMLAKAVHALLYVFMLGAPLTGWALVSTATIKMPTLVFGVLPWPHLPLGAAIHEPMEELHELLAWMGLALIVLHILGALRHQFLIKDNLLRRMGPGGSSALAGLLGLAVVAVYFGTGLSLSDGRKPAAETAEQAPMPTGTATPSVIAATPAAPATAEPTETPVAEDTTAAGPPPTWAIQPGGRLGFTIDNGGETIRGSFADWSGTISFDPDQPDNAPDIRIAVKLASASLGDATMDGMVQDGDFFASAANPTATFRSTQVRQNGTNRYTASGTLSLKGASKPQTVTFTLSGSGMKRKVTGTGSINRTAFGVGTGDSAANLASTVALSFSFDAVGK